MVDYFILDHAFILDMMIFPLAFSLGIWYYIIACKCAHSATG